MIRIGTLFSGIGSPEQAAKRVYNKDLELVFACEFDKFARQSFNANYKIDPTHFHKDINDMDGKQYKDKVDIVVGGSPCQDYSLAGLRAGVYGEKGILINEYFRIIDETRPPIFIYENVKGMLSDRNGKTIKEFVEAFRSIGYNCHYEVLNTKDYGVPQNRERIFIVGFLDTTHYYNFAFASKIKLERRLKDILEDNVDEKYYLSDKMISYLAKKERSIEPGSIETYFTPCLLANYHKTPTDGFYLKEPTLDLVGMLDIKGHDSIKRVYSENGISPTLTTMEGGNRQPKIEENYRIRKLTPRECFRLQDFPDSFKFVVSNSQLYKQAGNSISVNIMEMIFRQIEISRKENSDKGSLF